MATSTPNNPHSIPVERSRLIRLSRRDAKLYTSATIEYFDALLQAEKGGPDSEDHAEASSGFLKRAIDASLALGETLEDLKHELIGMSVESRRIERKVNTVVARMFEGETGVPTLAGMLAEAREVKEQEVLNDSGYWVEDEPEPDLLDLLRAKDEANHDVTPED